MTTGEPDGDLEVVRRLTAAFGAELAGLDLAAAVPWPTLPSVAALVDHLGGVHRWVIDVVRTGRSSAEPAAPALTRESARAWFEDGSEELLRVLSTVPPQTPCWVIGGRTGTAAFWRRRMVFENAKHLIDLRASGGRRWSAAPELTAERYADGIDELFTEFLPRSRPTLSHLPGAVVLRATDIERAWTITSDWSTDRRATALSVATEIRAGSGDLALMLWERADPLRSSDRFDVKGDRDVAAALRDAPIHPW